MSVLAESEIDTIIIRVSFRVLGLRKCFCAGGRVSRQAAACSFSHLATTSNGSAISVSTERDGGT